MTARYYVGTSYLGLDAMQCTAWTGTIHSH